MTWKQVWLHGFWNNDNDKLYGAIISAKIMKKKEADALMMID